MTYNVFGGTLNLAQSTYMKSCTKVTFCNISSRQRATERTLLADERQEVVGKGQSVHAVAEGC